LFAGGENDMLYAGNNRQGERILGTIVTEDDEAGFVRYIHVILTEAHYYDFLKRNTSLLEILRIAGSFFVVDFDYAGNAIASTLLLLDDVPLKYYPKDSYCPDFAPDPI
jgi:hypothetical protein